LTASANSLPAGVYVASVDSKSDASANGLKADDIITAINGVPTATTDALVCERDRYKPGDKITLTIYRRRTCGTLIINVKLLEDRGVAGKNDAGW
jgi:serine protease Do